MIVRIRCRRHKLNHGTPSSFGAGHRVAAPGGAWQRVGSAANRQPGANTAGSACKPRVLPVSSRRQRA